MTSIDAFEKTRVHFLSQARALQQKKIFTKWVNAHLELADQMAFEKPFISSYLQGGINDDSVEGHFALTFKGDESLHKVKDLYKDLSDGRVLLRLLEFFTGRKITLSRGKMRVHSLENVSKALDQMKQMNIHPGNIGPIDIVDGNVHLILGLIWTFILKFQLSRSLLIHHQEQESPVEMKNALLRWCQLKTAPYPQINIANFTSSWRDGLAMCALLHRHRPYLIDFAALASATTSPISRLSEAFSLAKKAFRIPTIVDPADFVAYSNDERCVVAVVATWYHRLNEDQEFKKSASRLAVVLDRVLTSERRMIAYMKKVYVFRRWMKTNLQYIVELSKFKDVKLISSKLAQWRENEKEKKVEEIGQIELAWLHLRTETLAWGYYLPSPPPEFDYPTVYRTWAQFDEAEAACIERIWQDQKKQSQKKRLLDKFYRKAEHHKLWLLECDHLVDLAAQSDSRGVQTSLKTWHSEVQISTKLLSQQRAIIQRGIQRNAALIVDAEANHNQKMQILHDLRSCDDYFCQIHKYWRVLSKKFRMREEFLLKRRTCLDKLLELVGLTEELKINWTYLLKQYPTENNISIWENKCNAAAEEVSNMSFDWSFIAKTKSECVFCCCYIQFWGINLAIRCTLLCYKKFFSETTKNADLYREMCKSLTSIKDWREHTRVLFGLIEQTPISVFNIESIDTLVSILSKVRLFIYEVGKQGGERSQSYEYTTDGKSQNQYQTVKPSQLTTNLPKPLLIRRSRSLETRPESLTNYGSSRIQRNTTVIRIYREFQSRHLTGLDIIRQLKASTQQKLALQKKELEEKRAMLCREMEELHRELSTLKMVADLLSSIPEIQAEANAIAEWIRHKFAYFVEFPIPDVLTELSNNLSGPNECWWEDPPYKNMVFLKYLHIQSRIQQKIMILTEIIKFRKVLKEIEQRFLLPTDVNPEYQLRKDSARSFQRIAAQTQRTIRMELTKLHQSLNEINQEATTRHEQLLAERAKIHAIQRCCELLPWIRQSQKCLSEIESPFLHLSTKASTEFFSLITNEPSLVALEKEIDFHTRTSLPILYTLQARLLNDSSWNTLIEHTYNAWNDLIHITKMKRLSIDTAKRLVHLNGELLNTRRWVKQKKELLLTTGETKYTMGEMIRMECRMGGWETDLNALKEQVGQMLEKIDTLNTALEDLQSPLSAQSESRVAVRGAKSILEELRSKLSTEWEEFMVLLNEYQKRLETSLAFQSMLQELEAMSTVLMSKHNTITSLELPTSISEINKQLEVFHTIATELESLNEKLEALVVHGKALAASQEEVVAVTVTERLDTLKCEWSDLLILCNHQLGSLAHQRGIKVVLCEIEGLNALLSRKENQIVQTNYLPTIEHIRGKIMTQKQVLMSIQALSDQVRLLQLKSDEHEFGEKYDVRVRTVTTRYTNIQEKAADVLRLLEFRLTEKEKLNQLKSIEEWTLERQTAVTAQFIANDATLQEQKAIQKYHLLKNFEAEVKSYGLLASEVFQSAQLTIKENQAISACLQEALDGTMKLWNEFNTTLAAQGGKLVEVYRAIIISEGCEELLEWLKRAAVKVFGLQVCDYKKPTDSSLQRPNFRSVSMTSLLVDSSEPGSLARLKRRSVSENCLHFLTTVGVNCADTFDLSAMKTAMVKMDELKLQLRNKRSFLQELKQHYQCLMENTDRFAQYEEKLRHVIAQFDKVKKWLSTCALSVTSYQEVFNALRTLRDENQWLEQKLTQLSNENTVQSLLEVQKSLIRHQNVTAEVKHRNARNLILIKTAIEWLRLGEVLKVQVIHPAKEKTCCVAFITAHQDLSKELLTKISELVFRQAMLRREICMQRTVLRHWQAWFVQHMDLLELYNWLTETESTVMIECHAARGLASAHAAIKKHSVVETIVSEFQAPRLRNLSTRTADLLYAIENMIAAEQKKLSRCLKITALLANTDETAKAKINRHKLRRRIHMLERSSAKLLSTQTSVQKQFTDLRDLVVEKKHRLYELLALNRLYEEVSDVEEWIWSRIEEVLVENTGRDLDEWAHLQRDFCDTYRRLICNEFTDQLVHEDLTSAPKLPDDFALLGQLPPLSDSPERLVRAIMVCRKMIYLKHSDSPQIAQWQDRLHEDWCELRELLQTRGELLKIAGNRLLFLHRCGEAITDLREKMDSLPAILGSDLQVLARQQRQHANFRQSVIPIGKRVNWVVRASNLLLPLYADVPAAEIKTQRLHLLEAWDQLTAIVEMRSQILQDAEVLSRWLTWLHHSLSWIASAQRIISSAQEHEVQEMEADSGRKLLQHELSGIVSQHKQLWDEICAWESSIHLHCEEATAANICHSVLETVDFETLPTFTGIRKILTRSVTQLKADWYAMGSTSSDAASVIQNSVFTSLCEVKPMLPSHIMQSGVALLIIRFHQLKIAWWRHWRHLEALTAKLNWLRDLQNLENWLISMEEVKYGNDLGSSLEETMALAEEHQKLSQFVALQGEKCHRLAKFEMTQFEDPDPDWETAMEDQMVEKLKHLKILPKLMSTSGTVASETASLQEEVKPVASAAFERMEGVLYQELVNRQYYSGVRNAEHWRKCFALLESNTVTLHVLDISGPPTAKRSRSWIAKDAEVDFRLLLCREMAANLVEQRATDARLFKIYNRVTGESQTFKAETRALAERWVAALNETCSKSPTMEECEQEFMQIERMEVCSPFKSPPPTQKSRFATCLPILRLMSKRSGRSHRKRRLQNPQQCQSRHSGSSTPTMDKEKGMDAEIACTRALSPHTLLSSLHAPTIGSGAQSRTVVALTLPLRVLYRRAMRHSNLPISPSHHSHLSMNAILGVGNGGDKGGGSGVGDIVAVTDDESSLTSPYATKDSEFCVLNGNGNDDSEVDIGDMNEFS